MSCSTEAFGVLAKIFPTTRSLCFFANPKTSKARCQLFGKLLEDKLYMHHAIQDRHTIIHDVNYKIAKDFTNKVKEKAIGQNVLTTLQLTLF